MNEISIDMRMIRASGIGTYLQNLVPLVIDQNPSCRFTLIGDAKELNQFPWVREKGVILKNCTAPIYSVREQYELVKVINRKCNLLWSPHYNIPLFYKGKLMVTVHDLFHLAMPQFVGGVHKRLYARALFTSVRYKANAIICVSHFTAREFKKIIGGSPKSIYVIHNGVDPSWFTIKKECNPQGKPYLLFVGNVKPHKNLSNLIKAFHLVMQDIPHDLVIVGKREGFITGDKIVAVLAETLGERVHFTGFIDDNTLRQYYKHADALVFPSLYEGFGLPAIEAMASGCPVIVSNRASLPEICGDSALYCDPYSPEDIAQKILMLLSDEQLKRALSHKGVKKASTYTWKRCALETSAVIRKVLAS